MKHFFSFQKLLLLIMILAVGEAGVCYVRNEYCRQHYRLDARAASVMNIKPDWQYGVVRGLYEYVMDGIHDGLYEGRLLAKAADPASRFIPVVPDGTCEVNLECRAGEPERQYLFCFLLDLPADDLRSDMVLHLPENSPVSGVAVLEGEAPGSEAARFLGDELTKVADPEEAVRKGGGLWFPSAGSRELHLPLATGQSTLWLVQRGAGQGASVALPLGVSRF